jgi:5'-methylthioadenosine phosphorylase
MIKETPVLGVLGGTGMYSIPGLELVDTLEINTPFGDPSGPIRLGRLNGKPIAFLARHGENHTLLPGEVNYRANIYAFKSIGIERVLAVSACGSLREAIHPGDIIVPDQLLDLTRGRAGTFFGQGVVAHLSAPDPFCPDLSSRLVRACEEVGAAVHPRGAYVTIEGPRFSTRAESRLYRTWGMDLIGMTTSPEAFLAREAELCCAVLAHVTDYDVWRPMEDAVTAEIVMTRLAANAEAARAAIARLVADLPAPRTCGCGEAMEGAFVSPPSSLDKAARDRLGVLLERHLD